jgi:hypothetical protein
MAKKIWVKGYTKPDGTKVKGHYREVERLYSDKKSTKKYETAVRMGADPKVALLKMIKNTNQSRRTPDSATLKKILGLNYSFGSKPTSKV